VRMYQEILKHACTELEGQHVVARNVIAQMLRLHQVALGHCADEEGKVFDIKSNRIDSLLEVLEDHSGAAIIWSSYRREVDKIVSRLKKKYGEGSVAAYHGGNRGARDAEERRFLSGDARFMVSTQAAGGRGNTWVNADLTVYCSNSYDLEHRLQSEDRNHRKGQKRSCTYIDLIARGTVEERIVRALRNKIDLATAITGENYREWLI
jgi:SNF2 family DNA or RNA helicase